MISTLSSGHLEKRNQWLIKLNNGCTFQVRTVTLSTGGGIAELETGGAEGTGQTIEKGVGLQHVRQKLGSIGDQRG